MSSFTITDSAKQQMKNLLLKNPDKWAVSLTVKGGGCAGFKYEWGFLDSESNVQSDHIIESWEDGRFAVDSVSAFYVLGTVIDWKEEVFGSHFEISNPNAKAGCGCGESFGV